MIAPGIIFFGNRMLSFFYNQRRVGKESSPLSWTGTWRWDVTSSAITTDTLPPFSSFACGRFVGSQVSHAREECNSTLNKRFVNGGWSHVGWHPLVFESGSRYGGCVPDWINEYKVKVFRCCIAPLANTVKRKTIIKLKPNLKCIY